MTADEHYIIDLCDEALKAKASRDYRLTSPTAQSGRTMMLDAFYPHLKLAIEITGLDPRLKDGFFRALTEQDVYVILIDKRVFALNGAGRLRRDIEEGREIVRGLLEPFLTKPGSERTHH